MSVDIASSYTFRIRSKGSYLCGKFTEIAAPCCCGGKQKFVSMLIQVQIIP